MHGNGSVSGSIGGTGGSVSSQGGAVPDMPQPSEGRVRNALVFGMGGPGGS